MKKKYIVTLTPEERRQLREMVSRGKAAARKLVHARILLKADAGEGGPAWGDPAIAEGLEVGTATVERVRQQFVEEGLAAALERRKPRREYPRKLDGDGEAHLLASRIGSSSTIRPSMAVGSIWPRSSSASWAGSAWRVESTTARPCALKPTPGPRPATARAAKSSGASQPKMHASN